MAPKALRSSAKLVEAGPRKATVLFEGADDAVERLSLSLNGEPLLPIRTVVNRNGVADGINLIADKRTGQADPPWRPVDRAAIIVTRVREGPWGLPDGRTTAARAALHTKGSIEYVTPSGQTSIRLDADKDYTFEGCFARHRCAAAVEIDLLTAAGTPLTTLTKPIPKASGGSSLDGYGRVVLKFHALAQTSVRIRLSIDRYDAPCESEDDAYLFFTALSLSTKGSGELRWQPEHLSADELAALSGGAALIELTLPHAQTGPEKAVLRVSDRFTGADIGEAQLALPLGSPLQFTVTSFDGLDLCGRVHEAADDDRLELAIDGIGSRIDHSERSWTRVRHQDPGARRLSRWRPAYCGAAGRTIGKAALPQCRDPSLPDNALGDAPRLQPCPVSNRAASARPTPLWECGSSSTSFGICAYALRAVLGGRTSARLVGRRAARTAERSRSDVEPGRQRRAGRVDPRLHVEHPRICTLRSGTPAFVQQYVVGAHCLHQ